MIEEIYSDLPSFKTIKFRDGLNILLADRNPESSDKQTRNGAGKSSLIELIQFLLGAEATEDLKSDALRTSTFGLTFQLAGKPITVERTASKPKMIRIVRADWEGWKMLPHLDSAGSHSLSVDEWKRVLGKLVFNLPEESETPMPSFRSLISYFVRRQSAQGFIDPTRFHDKQSVGDQQLSIMYLLGLDWAIPSQWEQLRRREAALKALRKSGADQTLGAIIGDAATLRTNLALVRDQRVRKAAELSDFKVLPQYRDFEVEASSLSTSIAKLANLNSSDKRRVNALEESLHKESALQQIDLRYVYEEAGLVFSDTTLKTLKDVSQFHASIVENRKSYLLAEIQNARRRVEVRSQEQEKAESRLRQIMAVLRTHGALEQFTLLQQEISQLSAREHILKDQLAAIELLDAESAEIQIEKNRLFRRLQQDFNEEEERLSSAITTFQSVSDQLYEDSGNLNIKESKSGPRFEIRIHGQKSKGIGNMQIFCFDMMLTRISQQRKVGPGFLVHDSHLFDGVDERQVGAALKIGSILSSEFGFQYIVTLNSDALPTFPDFDPTPFLLPVRLDDSSDTGGLYGLRFN